MEGKENSKLGRLAGKVILTGVAVLNLAGCSEGYYSGRVYEPVVLVSSQRDCNPVIILEEFNPNSGIIIPRQYPQPNFHSSGYNFNRPNFHQQRNNCYPPGFRGAGFSQPRHSYSPSFSAPRNNFNQQGYDLPVFNRR